MRLWASKQCVYIYIYILLYIFITIFTTMWIHNHMPSRLRAPSKHRSCYQVPLKAQLAPRRLVSGFIQLMDYPTLHQGVPPVIIIVQASFQVCDSLQSARPGIAIEFGKKLGTPTPQCLLHILKYVVTWSHRLEILTRPHLKVFIQGEIKAKAPPRLALSRLLRSRLADITRAAEIKPNGIHSMNH